MKKTQAMILTAVFAALTAVGGFLRIPFGTISFTMQVFFTCMAGLLLGPYWGSLSQLLYVLLGLIGLPIFTEGGGLMYVVKPTFGFLIGLIPMAFVVGMLTRGLGAKRTKSGAPLSRPMQFLWLLLAQLVGLVVLYAIGLPYLYIFMHGAWTFQKTVVSGCLIFLPFDLMKMILAALLALRIRPLLQKQR